MDAKKGVQGPHPSPMLGPATSPHPNIEHLIEKLHGVQKENAESNRQVAVRRRLDQAKTIRHYPPSPPGLLE